MTGCGKGGRPKGLPKSGGRQKGTPNRSTQAVREIFEELDFNPIRELVGMARDPKIRPDLKANILVNLCSYRFPKPKAVEETTTQPEKVEVVTRVEHEVGEPNGAANPSPEANPEEEPGDGLPE